MAPRGGWRSNGTAAQTSGDAGRCAGTAGPPVPPTLEGQPEGAPPLSPQDLFFKYTWNNFLHFQVELCVAAILSHAAREDRAVASGPEVGAEPAASSRDPETPQPAASHPEDTMVTHVSPASVPLPPCPVYPACAEPHPDCGHEC